MQAFIIALQFLTRLPVFFSVDWKPRQVGLSLLYYPLVGLLLGAILLLLFRLLAGLSPMLAAVILLTVWVLITGALHLDGLADSADAWAGGLGDKQRSLEIMKDPRAGPLAVVVLVLLLLFKFSALHMMLENNLWQALLIAPVLARSMVILFFLTTPYVREQGLGSDMASYLPKKSAVLILLLVMLALFGFVDLVTASVVSITTLVIFICLRYLMMKRIAGMTGDTIGASIEIIEAGCLLAFVLVNDVI